MVDRRTKEKQTGTRKQNEDEGLRNNQYLGSTVTLLRSRPRLKIMLNPIPFNHSSHIKYQRVLLYALISGKITPGLLYKDTSIVTSIMMNDRTLTEKKIISMG